MILIGLVLSVVLLLGRTHRRSTTVDWTPDRADDDADLRRLRDDLRQVASLRGVREIRRVLTEVVEATSFDRVRAELLEAPDPLLDRERDQDDSKAA